MASQDSEYSVYNSFGPHLWYFHSACVSIFKLIEATSTFFIISSYVTYKRRKVILWNNFGVMFWNEEFGGLVNSDCIFIFW